MGSRLHSCIWRMTLELLTVIPEVDVEPCAVLIQHECVHTLHADKARNAFSLPLLHFRMFNDTRPACKKHLQVIRIHMTERYDLAVTHDLVQPEAASIDEAFVLESLGP